MSTNKRNKKLDRRTGEKALEKYGFSLDVALCRANYEKIKMEDIVNSVRGILSYGGLGIERKCDVEEYIGKSYSGYLRRFGRAKRSLIIASYGEEYADTLTTAHKAIFADKPNVIEEDEVLIELKGGYMDADQHSDPRYIMIQKIGLDEKHTAVRVVYNSIIPKKIWGEMRDINLLLSSIISKMYGIDVVYGRVTSLSLMGEATAMFSNGKTKEIVGSKGAFQEELNLIGLDINDILDTMDIQIGALHASRELRSITDALEGVCQRAGAGESFTKLINYLEREVIPEVRESKELPKHSEVHEFSKKFIRAESKNDKLTVEALDKDDRKFMENSLDSLAESLSQTIIAYLTYHNLLYVTPEAEDAFLVLKPLRNMSSTGNKGQGFMNSTKGGHS